HSGTNGWLLDLGGTALRRFRPGHTLSPYAGAGLVYHHRDRLPPLSGYPELGALDVSFPDRPADASRRYVTLSATAGLEYSARRRFSLFAEVEGAYSTGRAYELEGPEAGWSRRANGSARPVVGLTFKLR